MRAALKIHREWWTMAEVGEHFRLKGDLDLRRMVMGCALRPAMYVEREMHPAYLVDGETAVDETMRVGVSGWLWTAQELARQHATFDCTYSILRDSPMHGRETTYYALPREEPALTLSGLLSVAVAFDENVAAIEEAHKQLERQRSEGDLGTRADRTREKILIGLAAEHMGWKPWEGEKAMKGLQDLHDAMTAIGIGVGVETIKRHLRDSWHRTKPVELAGR